MTYEKWVASLDHHTTGEVTFTNTSIPVHRVGNALLQGVPFKTVMEEYTYLSPLELKYAARYVYERQYCKAG